METLSFVINIVVIIIVVASIAIPIITKATANLTGTSTILCFVGVLLFLIIKITKII